MPTNHDNSNNLARDCRRTTAIHPPDVANDELRLIVKRSQVGSCQDVGVGTTTGRIRVRVGQGAESVRTCVETSLGSTQGSRWVSGGWVPGVSVRPDLHTAYEAPRTETEGLIAGFCQRAALAVEKVGVHDACFELGGDSVVAYQILMQVNRAFGVRLDAKRAFQQLTVAALAEMVDEHLLEELEAMSDEDAAQAD